MNVYFSYEHVVYDTIYYDTPSIDDGSMCAQLFVGTKLMVSCVYGIKTYQQFVNTLEDNIRSLGTISKLISDRNK